MALNYQQMIARLQEYWAEQGCVLMQPYHTEVGAGTFNPATVLRCLGPVPWRTAYVEPSIRPGDGRYGENPIRFQQFYQYQVVLKPSPDDVLDLYFASLEAIGIDLDLIPAEITYGLDRLAMLIQGKRTVFELEWAPGFTWEDVYRESERQWSAYNFEEAPVDVLMGRFDEHEAECRHLVDRGLTLPAYDQVLKCSHAFNLLDARGAISVTERAAYFGRVRSLARAVCELYLAQGVKDRAEAAV